MNFSYMYRQVCVDPAYMHDAEPRITFTGALFQLANRFETNVLSFHGQGIRLVDNNNSNTWALIALQTPLFVLGTFAIIPGLPLQAFREGVFVHSSPWEAIEEIVIGVTKGVFVFQENEKSVLRAI